MAGRRTTRPAPSRASSKKTTSGKKITKVKNGSVLDFLRFSESYTSLLLGIVVVIIASVLLISFLKGREFGKTPPPAPEISAAKIEPLLSVTPGKGSVGQQSQEETGATRPVTQAGLKGTYTVQAGDDLWHIAEKVYKDGYKWTLIAKANNITNPGMIFSGNVLTIPNARETQATTPAQAPQSQQEMMPAIVGNSYKVQHGDSLWSIAERRYKNGYRWIDIAKANNLTNPDLIHSDNIVQLPN